MPIGWWKLIRSKLLKLPGGVLVSVCALGLVSVAVLWTAVWYSERSNREAVLNSAGAQTLSIAVALREHVHGVISNADLVLQYLDNDYGRSSGPYAMPQWLIQSRFLREMSVQVGIIRADGYAQVSNNPVAPGEVDLSDREHFRVHLNPDAPQPFISRPVLGRTSGKPSIQITRRIERPDGSFDGVSVVSLDPAYFNRFFQSIDLGPHGIIYLIGRDGVLRARSTEAGSEIGIGKDFSGTSQMNMLLSAPHGTYTARSDIDGMKRIYSFSADSNYPVIVATGMAIDDILASHRSATMIQAAAATALSLLILWLVYRSMQELSRRLEGEAQLRQSQKLEAIGRLTAGVAHDFNNILTTIKGNVERAYASKRDGDWRSLLGNVEQAARKGERIVGNLLAYSRQQPLRRESADVNKIVGTVADLLCAGFGSRWPILCNLAPHLAPVVADGVQIETALLNLAFNARDAMPAGGRVIFETRNIGARETGLPQDLTRGPYVAICVKDSGTGMLAEVAAKAFDPFFTTKEQGTGLGLSQVYGLAKQLGGTVTIDTSQHDGTTVTIYLPAMRQAQAPMQTIDQPVPSLETLEAASSGARNILVADDEPQVREFICAALSDVGYGLVEAYDGPSALEALERNAAQFAVLDIRMPGMSGIDVYERARDSGWRGGVLFVTGYTDPAALDRITGLPFLMKPFRAHALRDQIAHVVAETDKTSLPSQA